MPAKSVIYAIRGGKTPGAYLLYPDAQRAGFAHRQAVGDATKFQADSEEEARGLADEFLALPPVSNWMADYQVWLNRQPFMLRAGAFLILFNIIFVLSHYLVVAAMALFNCDNAIVATTGTCKGLVELKSFISERIDQLVKVFIAEVMAGLTALALIMTGLVKL